jgi:hypothetical protein
MGTPKWASRLSFDGLALHLSELDLMADLDPDWIGWSAEVVALPPAGLDTGEVAP